MSRIFRGDAATVQIFLDDEPLAAREGESLLAALLAERGWDWLGLGRGPLCAMGACQGCLVFVEGEGVVAACRTLVRPGMRCRSALPDEGGTP